MRPVNSVASPPYRGSGRGNAAYRCDAVPGNFNVRSVNTTYSSSAIKRKIVVEITFVMKTSYVNSKNGFNRMA
ncbi:MAG: hypothetical protein ACM3MK_02485 [Chitinophagales bacterium]